MGDDYFIEIYLKLFWENISIQKYPLEISALAYRWAKDELLN